LAWNYFRPTKSLPGPPIVAGSTAAPDEHLSAQDIAAKISIWDSVLGSNIPLFSDLLGALNQTMIRWPGLIHDPGGRKQLHSELFEWRNRFIAAMEALDSLHDEYQNYPDVNAALLQPHAQSLQFAVQKFYEEIANINNDDPSNEILLRPLAGAISRDADAERAWVNTLNATANIKRAHLGQVK